jgi:hypothetical protein
MLWKQVPSWYSGNQMSPRIPLEDAVSERGPTQTQLVLRLTLQVRWMTAGLWLLEKYQGFPHLMTRFQRQAPSPALLPCEDTRVHFKRTPSMGRPHPPPHLSHLDIGVAVSRITMSEFLFFIYGPRLEQLVMHQELTKPEGGRTRQENWLSRPALLGAGSKCPGHGGPPRPVSVLHLPQWLGVLPLCAHPGCVGRN